MDPRSDVGPALAVAARTIDQPASVDQTLTAIARAARNFIPGFDAVGISTIRRGGGVETRAATGHVVYRLDYIQHSLGEGPSVEALADAEVVAAPRLWQDRRWPRYVPLARDMGLRSQLAVRLHDDDDGTVGGLNLYSTTSGDIDPEAAAIATLFAAQAATALSRTPESETVGAALSTCAVIGQAIGIVMERYKITEDQAFAFLIRASSHSNLELRDLVDGLADQITEVS